MPYTTDMNPEVSHTGSLPQRYMRGHKVLVGLSGDDTTILVDAMLFTVSELLNGDRMPPVDQIELYDGLIVFRHPNITKIYKYEV